MTVEKTNDHLNRLLVIHARSVPAFLAYAPPWWAGEHVKATEVLADIVTDQREIAARAGRLVVENGGTPVSAQFPDRFFTLHDLSLDFMLAELIRYQDRTIAALDQLVAQLPHASPAQELAAESLGMAKAHRDALGDLLGEPTGKPHRTP